MSGALALLAGAAFGLGLVIAADAARPQPGAAPGRPDRRRRPAVARLRPAAARRLATAAATGLLVGVATGWPVGGVLATAAVAGLPGLLGPDRAGRAALARVEALAGWTELLHATLAAAAGLHQAILATAANPPAPIRTQVAALAGRLRQGQPLPAALREFADQLADPTGDLVVAALLLAADRPAADLSELLAALADNAREQAAMRARVAASRARLRSSARIVTALTAVMVTGLVVLNREWMQPYATPAGQLVMATAGGLFILGLVGLARMSRLDGPPRLFADPGGRS